MEKSLNGEVGLGQALEGRHHRFSLQLLKILECLRLVAGSVKTTQVSDMQQKLDCSPDDQAQDHEVQQKKPRRVLDQVRALTTID
jgi:hypothetical protein